jgi:hypothetical protein
MKTQIGATMLAAVTALAVNAGAEPKTFRSSETRTSVLELYTSEACSSCPPAERWLSGLKNDRRLWKDTVVISFHVDYWDDLGWKDPLARPDFSERQRTYSTQWRANAVYTPGFVLDGGEWKGWFQQNALPPVSNEKVGVITATSTGAETWTVSFQPMENKTAEKISISAALLGFEMTSRVRAGENSGKTLKHDFVASRFVTSQAKLVGRSFETTVNLPPNPKLDPKRLGVVFWATKGESLKPIQAVGGL